MRYLKGLVLLAAPVAAFAVGYLVLREYALYKSFYSSLSEDIGNFRLVASSPEMPLSNGLGLSLASVANCCDQEFVSAVLGLAKTQESFVEAKKLAELEQSEISQIDNFLAQTGKDLATILSSTGFAQSRTIKDLQLSLQKLNQTMTLVTQSIAQIKNRSYLQTKLQDRATESIREIEDVLDIVKEIEKASVELIAVVQGGRSRDIERQLIKMGNLFSSYKHATSKVSEVDPKLFAELEIAKVLTDQRLRDAQLDVEQSFQQIEAKKRYRLSFRIFALLGL